MPKLYAHVFGKGANCSKCTMLKKRLSSLLESDYNDFEMVFHDVLTDDGMVAFLKTEVLNPSRIPALVVGMSGDGDYVSESVDPDALLENARTGYYIGLQTDYSAGGVITPEMIKAVLDKARTAVCE